MDKPTREEVLSGTDKELILWAGVFVIGSTWDYNCDCWHLGKGKFLAKEWSPANNADDAFELVDKLQELDETNRPKERLSLIYADEGGINGFCWEVIFRISGAYAIDKSMERAITKAAILAALNL